MAKKQTIIYVVTQGHYSAYSIQALFSTKALAEKYIEAGGSSWEDPEIEEWPLDEAVDLLEKGYQRFFIRMAPNGRVLEVNTESFGPPTPPGKKPGRDVARNFIGHITAQDARNAIKIMNERRSAYLNGIGMYEEKSKCAAAP